MYKTRKKWDAPSTNCCRISSINSLDPQNCDNSACFTEFSVLNLAILEFDSCRSQEKKPGGPFIDLSLSTTQPATIIYSGIRDHLIPYAGSSNKGDHCISDHFGM